MKFDRGTIALVLDAHTRYAPEPGGDGQQVDREFFAELTRSYLPLLQCLQELADDQVRFRLTVSLSPTLLHMAGDPSTQVAYTRYLTEQLASNLPDARRDQVETATRLWNETYQGRLASAFAKLQQAGHLDILATTATRACLPLLAPTPGALQAQVRNGIAEYRRLFRATPKGFWLPEAAYTPGIDDSLRCEGLEYALVDGRTLPEQAGGAQLSAVCPSGIRLHGLSRALGDRIHSDANGYWSAPVFHNAPGRTSPYNGDRARWVASEQGRDFAEAVQTEVVQHGHLAREPRLACSLPANLLGGKWLEGIDWLSSFLRATSAPTCDIRSATFREQKTDLPRAPLAYPATGAQTADTSLSRWIHPDNDWIYPQLHQAAQRLGRSLSTSNAEPGICRRALLQAGRELFLAQDSDLAGAIVGKVDPAACRFRDHLSACHRLLAEVESGMVGEQALFMREARHRILPTLRLESLREFAARLAGPPH